MIDLKNVFVTVFMAIKEDKQLLDLLEIKYEGVEVNDFMTQLRKQVVEVLNPDNLLDEYATRLSIHEQDGAYNYPSSVDNSFLAVDIYISVDKNVKDRRALLILKRLIEVLDSKQRKREGKQPLPIGLYGLNYHTRMLNQRTNGRTTGWEKYTVVFKYSYLV
ncbi:MAG: hypothetical protein U0L26_07620 [Cellulosilyticum sp.]|nr:hypothetical protein [Cellulosilyticum sp.]